MANKEKIHELLEKIDRLEVEHGSSSHKIDDLLNQAINREGAEVFKLRVTCLNGFTEITGYKGDALEFFGIKFHITPEYIYKVLTASMEAFSKTFDDEIKKYIGKDL